MQYNTEIAVSRAYGVEILKHRRARYGGRMCFGTRSATGYPLADHPELTLAICVEGEQSNEITGRGSNPGAGG